MDDDNVSHWRSRIAPPPGPSDRFVAQFAGADPHEAVQVDRPDLAVADLAGPGGIGDQVHHLVGLAGVDDDLDLDLRDELGLVLRAPEHLGLAPLPPEALDLTHGEAPDSGGS